MATKLPPADCIRCGRSINPYADCVYCVECIGVGGARLLDEAGEVLPLPERDRTPTRPELPAMPMRELVEKDPEHVWGDRNGAGL